MVIAVTTPTGHVGRHLVRMLLQAGVRPRLLLRDPSKLDSEVRDQVDTVVVDQQDGDAVLAATGGVHALYWVNPPTGADDPVAAQAQMGAHIARAVAEHGIGRTVFQSSIGAEKRCGVGDIDGLARTEEALDATGAPVLHLRCGYFFTNLLLQLEAVRGGVVPVSVPVDLPMAWVAPVDIARVAALRLLGPSWSGRQVQAVHGPADLTWAQATAVVAAATGHAVRAEQIPDDEMRAMLASFGMGPQQVEAMLGMSIGLRSDFTPEQPRTVLTTTPTALGGWAHDVLRPMLLS